MNQTIIVQEVTKKFRRFHANRPRTIQEAIVRGLRQMRTAEEFRALQEVSFTVESGQMVGIIGHNGAGKSTLLRLIGGIGKPDSGTIELHGRIGALLSLGAGFHDDLTGRENVFINGVISGLTLGEVHAAFDSIVTFAELERFIDSPLRTYSSGMRMRLGFAIAAHIEPEILLIDEVLAVGDAAFQQKSTNRIKQFKEKGCTVLIVSHNVDFIRENCDSALWLHMGQVKAYDQAEPVVSQYLRFMGEKASEQGDYQPSPVLSPITNET